MADCHIGGWRDDKLKEIGMLAFEKAINDIIERKLDFLLIAGDLFNTALPSIDMLKRTTIALKKMLSNNIPVYIIPGSHDFSPSDKTMIDVFEHAGLVKNVSKFKDGLLQFTHHDQNVKITGLLGRKGGLERFDYERLNKKHLEDEPGFKIFMFHTALNEFKPAGMELMDAQPVASLPKNFQYYAGGHVHFIFDRKENGSLLTYPGALFPNNFKELEEFKHGGFYIVDSELNFEWVPVNIKDVLSLRIDANAKSAVEIEKEILELNDFSDKVITIRIEGTLNDRPSSINFKNIYEQLNSAYCILRNTNKLCAKESEEIKPMDAENIDDIEMKMVEGSNISNPLLVKELISALSKEKYDGEKVTDFENRIANDAKKILNIEYL